MATGLFDFLDAINNTKEDLLVDDESIKTFRQSKFMILRGLSYFMDTTLQANEMNGKSELSEKMMNDFLIHSIKKKKRFSKWSKKSESTDDMKLIQDYYGFSVKKSEAALSILSKEQLDIIRQKMYTGGKSK
jgi:hypothetical protein